MSIVARGAELEALLWAAGVVATLRPVEDLNVVVSLSISNTFPVGEANLFRWRDLHDIRLESNIALGAWLRIVAEFRARGISLEGLNDQELIDASEELAATKDEQSTDLVLGTKLVTECTDAELRMRSSKQACACQP